MPTGGSRQVRAARKRKKRMARVVHDLTDAQWDALKASWGGCAYCGSPATSLQKDCVQAISRGGRYTLGNVVPACGSCNASKCNAEVTGWLRRKRLDERAFLVRHYEISTELTARFQSEEVETERSAGGRVAGDSDADGCERGGEQGVLLS